MIDTFAGGHIQSGVSAQNVAFGIITGITRDPKGNLVFCERSTNIIRRINADGTIETIAGQGIPGFSGDGGPATGALLNSPAFPKYDRAGNLYFADSDNFRIRRIDASGMVTTIAGTGIRGALGADGPAPQAQIDYVTDLAVDQAGTVYFTELVQTNFRRVTPSGHIEIYAVCPSCEQSVTSALATDPTGNVYLSDGRHIFKISTDGVLHNFAGFGETYDPNNGNGGPALNAPPGNFFALATDTAGNVYTEQSSPTVNDGPFVIRRIGTDGIINVVAGAFNGGSGIDGPALQASLATGYGVGLTADADGTVTFAASYRIRQLSQSTIRTLAPIIPAVDPDGTAALNALFVQPNSIAFDRAGNLYIGQTCIIQKIDVNRILSTVAGTGLCSDTEAVGPALTTRLNNVYSMAVGSHGQVYFVTFFGHMFEVSNGILSQVGPATNILLPTIAIDSQDRIYIFSSSGIVRIAPGSQPQPLPSLGPFQLTQTRPIAIAPNDDVYACCSRDGGVFHYSADLTRTEVLPIGNGIDNLFVHALAVDNSSAVWLGSTFGLTKGSAPFGGSCCSSPYGDGGPAESASIPTNSMAFAPNGDLYILDTNAGRVRRIHGSPPAVKPAIEPGGIVNAASYAGTAIAPGELISIFGTNFGPAGLDISAPQNNVVPKALNNVHVYFGLGNSGAIVARTPNQINVFVPYSVANGSSVQVIVDIDGVLSEPVTVPVAASAFGISTHDASGSGQGAIFNQDGSLNSKANPAARGSIVTLFGTGEGVTSPALPDGALVISTPYSKPQSPVIVKFADQTADVQYAGAAPFLPTGVLQINATIPASITPGDVPITVSIAGISTTRTVTVAVQ